MNKNRKSLDVRVRKKMSKNIRLGQNAFAAKEALQTTDQIKAELLLKRYPSKLKLKEELDGELKRMKIKKKVKTTSYHTHSKRTTPGPEISGRDSTPAHAHPESAKWDKTVKMQNVVKSKAFTKKMLKRK